MRQTRKTVGPVPTYNMRPSAYAHTTLTYYEFQFKVQLNITQHS